MKNVFSLFKSKPKEITPMSAEVLGPSVSRAVLAYKKLQTAHAAAAAKILEQDAQISAYQANSVRDAEIIAGYKAVLDDTFPDNGGSMGGISE